MVFRNVSKYMFLIGRVPHPGTACCQELNGTSR